MSPTTPPRPLERTINALKGSRAVATRYDKRAYVFHGTVTLAAMRLWRRWGHAGQLPVVLTAVALPIPRHPFGTHR